MRCGVGRWSSVAVFETWTPGGSGYRICGVDITID